MQTKEQALGKLNKSKFRSSFHLTKAEYKYVEDKGMDVIHSHARDFIRRKIAPAFPEKDGKQTPTHGHPIFKAMHGCAFCCRGCMLKWYHVPLGRELTDEQQERIARFLCAWVEQEHRKAKAKYEVRL